MKTVVIDQVANQMLAAASADGGKQLKPPLATTSDGRFVIVLDDAVAERLAMLAKDTGADWSEIIKEITR